MGPLFDDEANYWLFNWLESRGVRTVDDAKIVLGKPSSLPELRCVAEQWSENSGTIPATLNLMAGSGLSLDDELSCPSPNCRRQQVDKIFRHAWHYFDKILLPDRVGRLLIDPPKNMLKEELESALLASIDVVLYIKDIGASSLVFYYPTLDELNAAINREALEEPKNWQPAWSEVSRKLLTCADIEITRAGTRKYRVVIDAPFLEASAHFGIEITTSMSSREDALRKEAVHRWMHSQMGCLEEDMKRAHHLKGALASAIWSHEQAITLIANSPTPSNIAFRIDFPSLENVSIRDLLAIRAENGDSFLSFRNSLSRVAVEMSANCQNSDYEQIAERIKMDIIEPELLKLRTRLASARKALGRKSAATVGLAAIGTLCATSFGLIPTLASGAISTAAALSNLSKDISKYIDEAQIIETSDMYFLWKALKHVE
jgi:hypothetical protein